MPVAAIHADAWWSDIGTLAELTAANLAVVRGDVRTALAAQHTGTAGVHLCAGTRVAHDGVLEAPVAAGPGAAIGGGAHVRGAVILPGAVVPRETVVAGGIFGDPAAVAAAWRAA